MTISRNKIGNGTDDFPFQPDMNNINCSGWKVIEEKENEYIIEIFEYVSGLED